MYEPLKDKIGQSDGATGIIEGVDIDSLKSAVKGLIKYHEDNIEEYVKTFQKINEIPLDELYGTYYFDFIEIEYQSIMAIKHWLEDAI